MGKADASPCSTVFSASHPRRRARAARRKTLMLKRLHIDRATTNAPYLNRNWLVKSRYDFHGGISAKRFNPTTKAFADRLAAAGKPFKVVI